MPYTVFDDSDFVELNGTDWYPNNDDGQNEGAVTLRYALQVSINTVAAQMIDMLTPQVAYDQLVNKLGFTHLVERTDDGNTDISYAGMALGQLTNGEQNQSRKCVRPTRAGAIRAYIRREEHIPE
jgi:penicillin-binding protein 1A